jgi:hypothetical protein
MGETKKGARKKVSSTPLCLCVVIVPGTSLLTGGHTVRNGQLHLSVFETPKLEGILEPLEDVLQL